MATLYQHRVVVLLASCRRQVASRLSEQETCVPLTLLSRVRQIHCGGVDARLLCVPLALPVPSSVVRRRTLAKPVPHLPRGGRAFVVCATGSASALVCREEENTGKASATHKQHLNSGTFAGH